jgi:hypothetical protein
MQTIIPLKDAPAPDLLIEYPNGTVTALMFHFATEGDDLKAIARDAGYDLRWFSLDEGDEPELWRRYSEDDEGEEVVRDWNPVIPDGWQLAGKWDTEDGPTVHFIRKHEAGE